MKYVKNLNFAKFIRNKKINDNIVKIFKKAFYANKLIFKKNS